MTDATFIQWKGTDLCMDYTLPCGCDDHVDGMFCYTIYCPTHNRAFDLDTRIRFIEIDPDDRNPRSTYTCGIDMGDR